MKRVFLIIVGLAMVVGYASASPKGGELANYLYANSLYGIANPLPQTAGPLAAEPAVTPYAMSSSQVKATRTKDLTMGILGNIFIPGLGSALIGDHNALWIFGGYAASVVAISVGAIGATASAASALSTPTASAPNLTLWYIIMGIGSVGALGFEGWGIYSPIHYVNQKFPAS